MRKNKQLVCDKEIGDCLRACITSILNIPNNPKLPNCDNFYWFSEWYNILANIGLALHYEQIACWRSGYWIASVPSKNFPGTSHAIVMLGSSVFHDPSPREKYQTGDDLLGRNIVYGGYYLEVTDSSKLHKYNFFKKRYLKN